MYQFRSSETRWFFRADRRDWRSLQEWFLRIPGALIEEQPTRTDFYYRLSSSPNFGIKLRMEGEGKAETKEQIRNHGPVRYHTRCEGLVNDWVKWSFALNEPAVQETDLGASWLPVIKDRQLQKYRIEQNSAKQYHITAIPGRDFPEAGFGLEFTRISVAGNQWYSLGFEAFDAGGHQRQMLDAGIDYLFSLGEAPALALEDSMSYYRWLSNLVVTE